MRLNSREDTFPYNYKHIHTRMFAAKKGEIEKMKPLLEQEGPNSSSFNELEIMSSREIAYQVRYLKCI